MALLTGATIEAVGDSITYGFGDPTVIANGSWRFHLASPYETFIRTKPVWKGTMVALGMPESGKRMLGVSGRRIDEILTIDSGVEALSLDAAALAVFLLGTNNCTQIESGAWVGTVATSIVDYGTLLDGYRVARPDGIAVVCKIIPHTDADVNVVIDEFNAALVAYLATRSDSAYIVIADLNAAFKAYPSYLSALYHDTTHQNDLGSQVIASTIMSAIEAGVTVSPRMPTRRRRGIKPHVGSLRYNQSTATTLGSDQMLDSTGPWAVSMDVDFSRNTGTFTGILALKTDQATPFIFASLPGTGQGGRGLELGSQSNFLRMFPLITVEPNAYNRYNKGWHKILLKYDGVSRTALSSYKLFIDGEHIPLAMGAGLGATANVNEISRVISGSALGTFNMADLTIWNGGTAMTAQQVRDWHFGNKLPVGPTLTHRWQHTDGSGSTLTDSVGSADGTIGTATWSNDVPTKARSNASARSVAGARTVAT